MFLNVAAVAGMSISVAIGLGFKHPGTVDEQLTYYRWQIEWLVPSCSGEISLIV